MLIGIRRCFFSFHFFIFSFFVFLFYFLDGNGELGSFFPLFFIPFLELWIVVELASVGLIE